MSPVGWFQIALTVATVLLLARPIGAYCANVYSNEPNRLDRIFGPIESVVYRGGGVDPRAPMGWKTYAAAVVLFNGLGLVFVFGLQLLQGFLPLNPQGFAAPTWHSSLNTAVSFVSNTNWQGYGGESTMSYLTQMVALGSQNFLSAATGMAVLAALARGFARKESADIGNFWADMTRTTTRILLPLSLVFALFLVSQGVVQTFAPYVTAQTVDVAGDIHEQILPLGPAASQIAIKQLGTNGGGFFNVNSAHPFENPTPLTNFFEMVSILLLPAALCATFGRMVGDLRQGQTLIAAMLAILVPLLLLTAWFEATPNGLLEHAGVIGASLEGKETRFGVSASAIWAVFTTAASNGSVNAMHDSFSPLGGMVAMWLMQLGEVVFGGVGSGLYGMLCFALVTVFLAGLMVGRTPEYLGKKVEAFEMKMAALAILAPSAMVLLGTALAVSTEAGRAGVFNPGPHGFSEVLYALSSASNNNGSAFGGLGANTLFYNLLLTVAMLIGRYAVAIPVIAMAGSLAAKKRVAAGAGTLPTHGPLFVAMLVAVVALVGALTFLPALSLGPIVEHLVLRESK